MNYNNNFLLFLVISFIFPAITSSELTLFNGKSYPPNSYKPYSGDVIDYYNESFR